MVSHVHVIGWVSVECFGFVADYATLFPEQFGQNEKLNVSPTWTKWVKAVVPDIMEEPNEDYKRFSSVKYC